MRSKCWPFVCKRGAVGTMTCVATDLNQRLKYASVFLNLFQTQNFFVFYF